MTTDRNGWRTGLRNLASSATAGIGDVVNEDRIRLAVTGLSRAGKTVFITSLIQNLLALGARKKTLPRLSARLASEGGSRLLHVAVLPAGTSALPRFDFAGNLAALAAERPAWPRRTEDIAEISLALTVKRKSSVGQRLGSRRVRLDILDYPGEWLLDLPLLDQTFAQWSAQTFDLLRQSPRREACAAFLDFIANLRSADPADEGLVRQGHALYRAGLETCRSQHGLRYLQPGRFLCPGPRGDVPLMWFFPLEVPSGGPSRSGTLGALLSERFEAYKQHMRTGFFDSWFGSFNRQVVLVDVLGALYSGRAAFQDTVRAIQDIATALRYGTRPGIARHVAAAALRGTSHVLPPILGRMAGSRAQHWSGQQIERVVFAATKADHVPALKRDNLRHLLRSLSDPTEALQAGHGAQVTYQVVASLLSTEDGIGKFEGRPVQLVSGILLGEDKMRGYDVGDVPSSMPPPGFWAERFLALPEFRPPVIDPTGQNGLPHLGLDLVLDELIGDLL